MKPIDAARQALEASTLELARKLKRQLPPGVGFALFLFDYGADGNTAYASTGSREDMIRAMREWLSKVET